MILATLCAALAAPPDVPRPAPAPLVVQDVPLAPGGPRLLLTERHVAPIVSLQLRLDTSGLLDAGRVQQGAVAALDATWQGPWSRGPRAAIARLGGWSGVECGWEQCVLALETPSQALDAALEAFAALVHTPALDPVDLAEWRRDTRDGHLGAPRDGTAVHGWAVRRTLWAGSRRVTPRGLLYRWVSPGQLAETRRRVVTEARATLTVVGDTTLDVVRPLLAAHFGGLAGTVAIVDEPAPDLDEDRLLLVDVPWMSRPRLTVAWASPGTHEDDQPGWQIAWQALAEGLGARVLARVRERDGFVYSIGGDYLETSPDAGYSYLDLVVDQDDVAAVIVAVEEELARLQRDGLAPEELRAAVEGQIGRETLGMTRGLELARLLRPHEGVPAFYARRVPAYRAVTLDQVNRAARTWLDHPRTWVVTADRDAVEPLLAARELVPTARWSRRRAVRGPLLP